MDNSDLTIREAQQIIDEWIRGIGKGYFSPLTNMAVLTEETGELARVISRTYGEQRAKPGEFPDGPRAALSEELADVLWVTMCLANQTGIDLTAALRSSLAKKTRRDSSRF